MKLRTKISILILLAWLVITTIVYLGSQLIIKQSFLSLEEESAFNNIQRIHQTIQQMQHSVSSALGSWAIWDDTYVFMTDKNQKYIDSNLKVSSFTSSDVDMVLYFDTAGKPFYSIAADATRTKTAPVPKEIFSYLAPNSKIVYQPTPESGIDGLVSIPSGILMVAAHSIVTSNNTGPVHGTLMMAKYLTPLEIKKLSEITKVNTSIYPISAIKPGSELFTAFNTLKNSDPGGGR